MIRVGIVGGTGYTGVELLRLLSGHHQAQLHAVTSRSEAGTRVDQAYPSLRGHVDLTFSEPALELLAECQLVFFATPNGAAMRMAPQLLSQGVRIIDLAADFRLRSANVWEQWYGEAHLCPELLSEAVYGLPETQREKIRSARLIACPGCYPTAVQLGLLPLLEADLACTDSLIADVKSGASGAGRKAEISLLMSESGESFKAYSVSGHRHLPEIQQQLSEVAGKSVNLTFVPHLLPMIRGIHATLYARLRDPSTDLQSLYENRYQAERFVEVLPPDSHPDTRNVRGSNRCQIAVHRPQNGDLAVILVVEDNLVKGAAGQAVQNMNLMFGLAEDSGLNQPGLYP